MFDVSALPTLNASLNSLCTLLLIAGFIAIKSGRQTVHRNCMVAALVCSVLFLTSYLIYHAQIGSKPFEETGWIRPVYFSILLTHTILAAVIVPLVIVTVRFAVLKRFDRHAAWARWTWPLWMYVSITGVVIYAMLYH